MARITEVDLGNGTTAKITRPDREDFDDNLGGAVQYALANVATWLAETSGKALGSFGGSALVSFLEQVEPHLIEIYEPLIDELLKTPDIPRFFKEILENIKAQESEAAAIVGNAVLGSAAGGVTGGLLTTLLAPLTYGLNDLVRPARPGVADTLAMYWRGEIDDPTLDDWLSDQGWPALAIEAFKETVKPRPDLATLLRYAWRFEDGTAGAEEEAQLRGYDPVDITRIIEGLRPRPALDSLLRYGWRFEAGTDKAEEELDKRGYLDTDVDKIVEALRPRADLATIISYAWRMEKDPAAAKPELEARGYSEEDVDRFVELGHRIPGPTDLVRFALREVWDDAVAAKYGYDADFRPEFEEWMGKQGFDPEWAKAYWRAHWLIPSASMGFEMFQRDFITQEELDDLLRIGDYPSYWRDKLTQIAYRVYNRVDVRRMYRVGTFQTAEEVYTAYLELGYPPEKALALTDFTIREYGEEEREGTKADVLLAYELGRFSDREAYEYLRALDYPDWIAATYIARVDFKKDNKRANEVIKQVKTLYVNGLISKSEVFSRLAAQQLPSGEIHEYLELWEITRIGKVKRPTVTKLREWFVQGVISDAELRQEVQGHGYDDRYTGWYIEDALRDKAEREKDEAEKAIKEAQRLEKEEVVNLYREQKAEIDVELAETRLRITELQLALTQVVSVEDEPAIRLRIKEIEAEISNKVIAKEALDVGIKELEQKLLLAETDEEAATYKIAIADLKRSKEEWDLEIAVERHQIDLLQAQLQRLSPAAEVAEIREDIARLQEKVKELILEKAALQLEIKPW